MPPPWFDEGWTLSVARNWVETGKYARFLNDVPISATGMAWNFPVTAPIALSFRLFGIGILQGRLPSALFTIVATFLVYLLTKQLYDEKTAVASLLLILLGFPFPLATGRQAIGEPAMIFYLLAGSCAFLDFLKKRSIFVGFACVLLWSAALVSKQQPLPFWTLSMFITILVAGFRRDRFTFLASVAIALSTLIVRQGMLTLQASLEANLMLYGAPMRGLLSVTGWVPIWEIRRRVLSSIVLYAFPLILGLGYVFFQALFTWRSEVATGSLFYLRLTYWSLVTSWLAWYAVGAMNWERYLYPVTFLGSIFVAVLLSKLTDDFRFSKIIVRAGEMLRTFRFSMTGMQAIVSILLLSYMGTVAVKTSMSMISNNDAEELAQYLNQSTPPDAVLETYDSELLFLVQRRFSFPPDQVQVELNKRTFLGQNANIPYDPMRANPDYLIVGPFSSMWKLYDSVLAQQDAWQLIYELPSYSVYEHVH